MGWSIVTCFCSTSENRVAPEKIEIFCNSLRDSEACAIGDQPGEACAEAIACY
ncbi:hypothetical protein IQ277_35130 [Nostocales cyanobacterium LEGE 12452]|nr:hypothetical protein [Nostocales cyanobacterium LEGE 12452]